MKHATRLVVSAAVSVLIVGLLLSLASSLGGDVSPASVFSGVASALPAFVAAYVACQFAQALARARRARLLLGASLGAAESAPAPGANIAGSASAPAPGSGRVPGLFRMLLVTFVRGACADMLPARLGELSYVAMLNRGCAVPAADCLSSLSIGLLFDFLALLAVLAVAIPAAAQGLSLLGSAVLLAAICAVGVAGLFFVLPAAAAWKWERFALFRWRPAAAVVKLARDVAAAVLAVRRGRVAGRVLALSVAVRAAKYAGLWALFVAVTRPLWPALSQAPVAAVLVALVAAEGAASLPVPTFLSFGSYEAGGLAALTALGFPAGDSLVAMMAMHLLSQIVDYSLGGLAFLVFSWCAPAAGEPSPAPAASGYVPEASASGPVLRLALAAAFLAASLLFLAFQLRAVKKRGRLSAPPAGEAVAASPEEAVARDASLRAFGGKIVWTSNRSGSHDLWMLDGPGSSPRRLTSSGFTDAYPRFSPDGSRVAFSRSTEPWVSQRDFEKWDTWVLDLATGEERLVATNACQACWCGGDSVAFVRAGGTQLVLAAADGGGEKVLLESGVPPLGDGVLVTLPDARPDSAPSGDRVPFQFLVTLRGRRRATAEFVPGAGFRDVRGQLLSDLAGGCQMVWRGETGGVAWIDHPGRMKNSVYVRPGTGDYPREVLLDAEEPWSHEYFPRFDASGRFLVYGASRGGHEQDSEDYEIFLWDTASPETPPARLTFHEGNDGWPDLWRAP